MIKRIAVLVIVLSLMIAATLTVAELALRDQYARDQYAEARRRPPHPFLQVLASGQVDHVNEAGFRGDPIEVQKPRHSYRIVTLGGSTTLGVANPYAESYPYLLEQALKARYPGAHIEVQNAGSAWYSTAHSLINYELRVRRFKPDLVIFFEAINDLMRSFAPPWFAAGEFRPDYGHYLGPYTRWRGPDVDTVGGQSESPFSNLLLFRNLQRRFFDDPSPFNHRDPVNVANVAARLRPVDIERFASLESYREYYDLLVRTIQMDGHTIVAATQPSMYRPDLTEQDKALLFFGPIFCADRGGYPTLESLMRGMQQFNQAAAAVAASRGVPLLDFAAAVPKNGAYFFDDVHMRKSANQILANTAADWIAAHHLIETATRAPQ